MTKHGIFATSSPRYAQYGSAQKSATLAGGIIAAPTFGACNVGGRVPPNYRRKYFGAFVGADIIRPVVSPPGKQHRRIALTIQFQTFANAIRRYNDETWYICNIGGLVGV